MTNLQAIDLLKGLEQSLDDYCELNDEGKTAFGMAITALELSGNSEQLPSAQPEQRWIPVTERLPENADHPGAFCPRYQVTTPYGVTEGWYRPYDNGRGGQWYALFWFMSHIYEIWNIDFERGDVPKVIGKAPVIAWRPFPETYKEVSNGTT